MFDLSPPCKSSMYDGTIPEVDVYMCFADVDAGSYYDAGPDWEMQTVESITVCNVEDYYRHGLPDYHTIKPTKPFCTQTHMGEYMEVLRDVHKSDCVTAEGVKLGTGDDNAASMNDIYLDDCDAYDTCPSCGSSSCTSGGPGFGKTGNRRRTP